MAIEKKKSGISRRDFIRGSGLAVGGAAISASVLASCAKTVKIPGQTTTTTVFECPYDKLIFNTLTDLQTHLDTVHGGAKAAVAGAAVATGLTKFIVNGVTTELKVNDNSTLAQVLREKLRLTGTKISCDEGICGSCTVIIEGRAVRSCMILASEAGDKNVTTIEGLSKPDGKIHPLQQGFLDGWGGMCSYCIPGQIMTAKAFLDKKPDPTRAEVRAAMNSNLCMCASYEGITNSVLLGAKLMKGG